jgi:hypothetical protein
MRSGVGKIRTARIRKLIIDIRMLPERNKTENRIAKSSMKINIAL